MESVDDPLESRGISVVSKLHPKNGKGVPGAQHWHQQCDRPRHFFLKNS